MKKLIIILTVLIIFRFSSITYFNKHQLDAPIPITAAIDIASQQINVSYITNRFIPIDVAYISIDGYTFPPTSASYTSNLSLNAIAYKDYHFQSLYTASFDATYVDQTFLDNLSESDQLTLHFENSFALPLPFKKLQTHEQSDVLEFLSSYSGPDGQYSRYSVKIPFTLESISLLNENRSDIKLLKVNQKTYEYPFTSSINLKVNDVLYIETTSGISYYPGELFMMELNGVSTNGKTVTATIFENLNEQPSQTWLNKQLKEHID